MTGETRMNKTLAILALLVVTTFAQADEIHGTNYRLDIRAKIKNLDHRLYVEEAATINIIDQLSIIEISSQECIENTHSIFNYHDEIGRASCRERV